MLNETRTIRNAPPRLSDVLFERTNRSFGSLAALPSNIDAVEAALLFSAGLRSFVAIVGPSGWGKTHLLNAVAYRFSVEQERASEVLSAVDYLAHPGRAEHEVLILDNVQEALQRGRPRLALRYSLERRVRLGKPTLLAFTLPRNSRAVRNLLPSARSWIVATMDAAEPSERVLLIHQMASAEGLALSPRLVKLIAREMHGNGRTLAGALKRLRLTSSQWLDDRATLRACGVLDPFFADNSGWDLKLRILKVADHNRSAFTKVAINDLALFVMLREASLCESDVARAFGIAPAEVYLRAARFEKQVSEMPELRVYVRQLTEMVVASLAHD